MQELQIKKVKNFIKVLSHLEDLEAKLKKSKDEQTFFEKEIRDLESRLEAIACQLNGQKLDLYPLKKLEKE